MSLYLPFQILSAKIYDEWTARDARDAIILFFGGWEFGDQNQKLELRHD